MSDCRGYSLTEVLVAVAISLVGTSILLTMQSRVAQFAVRTHQKIDTLEFEQDLGRVLASPDACTCLMRGKALTPVGAYLRTDLASLSEYKVGAPRVLSDGSLNCQSTGRVLATTGQNLTTSQYNLRVNRISLVDVKRSGDDAQQDYSGQFEIEFTSPGGLAIHNTRISSHFTIVGTQISSCSAMPRILTIALSETVTNNDRLQRDETSAKCPDGTKVIGGGWMGLPYPEPVTYLTPTMAITRGCLTRNAISYASPPSFYKHVLTAEVDPPNNAFRVVAQCTATQAVALCFRSNILQ